VTKRLKGRKRILRNLAEEARLAKLPKPSAGGPAPMRLSTTGNNAVRAYGINRSARSGVSYKRPKPKR